MKKHERVKKIIEKDINRIVDFMNLSEWCININYTEKKKGGVIMQNRISISYLTSDVDVFDIAYDKKRDKREILEALIHEFSHIITEPLYISAIENVHREKHDYIEMEREQATERIARITYKALF